MKIKIMYPNQYGINTAKPSWEVSETPLISVSTTGEVLTSTFTTGGITAE